MNSQTLTNLSCAKFSSWGAYQAAKRLASNWTGFQRGRKAAISLSKQRQHLSAMRQWIAMGNMQTAQVHYQMWKTERANYLVLVGWY